MCFSINGRVFLLIDVFAQIDEPMGMTWTSRGIPAPHFLTSAYSLDLEQLLGNLSVSAHWKWELGAVGCLIQHWIQTALYSWVEILTPENQHQANTGRSKWNSAREPPLLLSTSRFHLSMEKLCAVTHLSEIHQIYTCSQGCNISACCPWG